MEEQIPWDQGLLTVDQVSRRLSIPKHTLRFWENAFEGILVPSRTQGGQRRYSPENISMIGEINRLRKLGMGLSEVKRKLNTKEKNDSTFSNRIDLLANRVAEVVKAEVNQFLNCEKGTYE